MLWWHVKYLGDGAVKSGLDWHCDIDRGGLTCVVVFFSFDLLGNSMHSCFICPVTGNGFHYCYVPM